MLQRISISHLAFLLLVCFAAIFLNWSAFDASDKLYNLIIVVPSGALCLLFVAWIAVDAWRKRGQAVADAPSADEVRARRQTALGDLMFLGLFAVLCFSLTAVGFDVATFAFVWVGILLGGERRWWPPLVFSALFTLVLVKGFGALFPFPMPLMVF